MGYRIQFKASVFEDLKVIGPTKGERILRDIYQKLGQDPKRGDVLKSGDTELWQHKVGDFTVVYTFSGDLIKVLLII